MAPELDMGIGMGMGFSMEAFSSSTNINSTVTTTNPYCGLPSTDTLRIDDLLNFDTQDGVYEATNDHHYQLHLPHSSYRYSTSSAGNCLFLGGNDHNNSNSSVAHFGTFSDDLYMPSEEAAELEWLSKFVEDSFCDVPLTIPDTNGNFSNINPPVTTADSNSHHQNTTTVPGRARSKRSTAPGQPSATAPTTTWSSLAPQLSSSPSSSSSSSSDGKQRSGHGSMLETRNGGVRKCTHCSSEKTPQWRTGPLGPKTLCNACGVRYKSGRLVPEYRPAASPTFVLTQHSNSHRKVMELRRQKELLFRHQHQQHQHSSESSPSTATNATMTRPDLLLRDYEV